MPPKAAPAAARARRPKPAAAAVKASAKKSGTILVRLRTATAVVGEVDDHQPLVRVAGAWSYILRNRSRWAGDSDMRESIGRRAMEALGSLGISEGVLEGVIANSVQQLEVEVVEAALGQKGLSKERKEVIAELLQAAASMPWEFLLATSTSYLGRIEPLLITRLLARPGAKPVQTRPARFLFVESAPGRLYGTYSFEHELERLTAATGHSEWLRSRSETIGPLDRSIKDAKPNAIHVSGIDNHQAARLMPGFYEEEQIEDKVRDGVPDGMVIRGARVREEPIPYDSLARVLTSGSVRPQLITLNLYHSSARIAPECVRAGALAALGFQDEVNDELAEVFFQALYRHWYKNPGAGLPRALGETWKELKDQGRDLYGTGIVIWLAHSAFVHGQTAFERRTPMTSRRPRPVLATPVQVSKMQKVPISDILQVEVDVPEVVNYSLLHNARPFLTKLNLNKLVEHALEQVEVIVDLHVGEVSLPFRHTEVLLDAAQVALADKVQLPLTAPLLRTSRERVQSSLYVRVVWQGRIAYEQTHHVTLLPVDEWLDDTANNPWLPSFVLPRDPAVARIISMARRHLVTLADDATAGFDGYQSIDRTSKRTIEDTLELVDTQVEAIWAALVHESKPQYINPPPAYSERTQRLRSPSEILSTNSGTCVDLALLLASCLEYIDVYPVIVLLSGHAFVGYWRDCDDHDDFRQVCAAPASAGLSLGKLSQVTELPLVDQYGWRLAMQQYPEILGYLRSDKLKFLEATGLCFNYSFSEALEEGAANLSAPDDFDSLLDIRLARSAEPSVTPLPIILTQPENRGAK